MKDIPLALRSQTFPSPCLLSGAQTAKDFTTKAPKAQKGMGYMTNNSFLLLSFSYFEEKESKKETIILQIRPWSAFCAFVVIIVVVVVGGGW